MKASLLFLLVAACGDSSGSKMDAPAGGGSDAHVQMDAPGLVYDCAHYCTTITSACTGAQAQYLTMQTCMASCSHFPAGTPPEQTNDGLACRVYHANAAVADPATHCVHAGPSGAGVCGTPCQGFCDLAVAECPTQYPSAGNCATACAGYATTPPYTSNVQSGNSLSCRIYHATAASTDPGTHCPHTAAVSATCQ